MLPLRIGVVGVQDHHCLRFLLTRKSHEKVFDVFEPLIDCEKKIEKLVKVGKERDWGECSKLEKREDEVVGEILKRISKVGPSPKKAWH